MHHLYPILFRTFMAYSTFLLALMALCLFNCVCGTSRNSPPSGALTVGPHGTYKTISAAVRAASKGATIFIYAGTYNEAVYITTSGLTIYGQTSKCAVFFFCCPTSVANQCFVMDDSTSSYTSNTVTITHGGSAANSGNDDASGTLRVHADSFSMYNINVVNSYGIGSQALALSAYGNAQVRINVLWYRVLRNNVHYFLRASMAAHLLVTKIQFLLISEHNILALRILRAP